VAAPPAPGGGAVTPQQFVDGVTLDGPPAALVGDHRSEPAVLTPKSPVPNPGVAVDTRITLTPANGVSGPAVSPSTPWPAAAASGAPFTANVRSDAVAVDARLDLLNAPVVRAAAPPVRRILIADHRQANLIASWKPEITFDDNGNPNVFTGAEVVRYQNGIHNFRLGAVLPPPLTNPGLTVSVVVRVKRGAAVIFAAPAAPLPADQDHITPVAALLNEPGGLPVAGDPLVFEFQLVDAAAAVLDTKPVPIAVLPSAVYTQPAAEAAAHADRLFLNDPSAAGFVGLMTAAGGMNANLAGSVTAGTIILQPLTIRHDSAAHVTAARAGVPHPEETAYFAGDTYAAAPNTGTFIAATGAGAYSRLGGVLPTATPHMVAVNRTKDVAAGTKRPPDELMLLTVHESTHALDVQVPPDTALEQQYKTEFRAYWNDGRFSALTTKFDPALPPPGPRSKRSRAIFEEMYGSPTYRDVKPAYDGNPAFRRMVDNLLFPDGINIILSPRLDALQALIQAGVGASFATFRNNVQAFVGLGPNPAPAVGVLTADDRAAVASSRAWRDLVEAKVPGAANRAAIKTDLGIP
jgi:hypothetical protein